MAPADLTTEMVTKLREEPELAYLGVGDELPTGPERAAASGYIVLHAPTPGEDVILLQTWGCPDCGKPFQWAEVVVRCGRITSIEPIRLTRQAIDRGNYIEQDARAVAAEFLPGTLGFDLDDPAVVDALRRHLPSEDQLY